MKMTPTGGVWWKTRTTVASIVLLKKELWSWFGWRSYRLGLLKPELEVIACLRGESVHLFIKPEKHCIYSMLKERTEPWLLCCFKPKQRSSGWQETKRIPALSAAIVAWQCCRSPTVVIETTAQSVYVRYMWTTSLETVLTIVKE